MTDLSTNFFGNQLFSMGKFNVFPKSNYPFFKYYLADEYQNFYVHETLPSMPMITP
jgi:hypothetical protein